MMFVRLWRAIDGMFVPLAKSVCHRKWRRLEKRVGVLSCRMGLLQMGAGAQLFQTVPGLSDMATGGIGAKRALAAIKQALESGAHVNWTSVLDTLDEIESFLKDANFVLDEYDRGRPKGDRMFVVRKELRGLF